MAKYTEENIIEGLYAKLDEIYDELNKKYAGDVENMFDGLRNIMKRELVDYPKEIEQNVLEWINGEELSEINFHGVSMKKIIDLNRIHNCNIPTLIRNLIFYEKINYRNKDVIYQGLTKGFDKIV